MLSNSVNYDFSNYSKALICARIYICKLFSMRIQALLQLYIHVIPQTAYARIVAVCKKKAYFIIIFYAQRRLKSGSVNSQADLSLRWVKTRNLCVFFHAVVLFYSSLSCSLDLLKPTCIW